MLECIRDSKVRRRTPAEEPTGVNLKEGRRRDEQGKIKEEERREQERGRDKGKEGREKRKKGEKMKGE